MTTAKSSNKLMIWLVVLVVILAVFFAWKAMTAPNYGPNAAPAQTTTSNAAATPSQPSVPVTQGQVGVNVQQQTKGGA